jgi:hypothetical protein
MARAMPRSSLPSNEPGQPQRWAASLALSLLLHALAVAGLAGIVYEVTASPRRADTIADVVMTLHSGSVQAFTARPPTYVQPLRSVLSSGAPAPEIESGPTLAQVLANVQNQTVGVSALGSVSASSGSALDAVAAALGASGSPTGAQPGAGGVAGMSVAFAGLSAQGQQARSVVYAVDASGPMVSTLPEVMRELMRSVDSLQPTQRFAVILFRDNGTSAHALFQSDLVEATPSNKTALRAWLTGVNAGGRSNPMDGLRRALEMRPQVVFLLSRSIARGAGNPWDAGSDATLAELETLNPADLGGRRATVIKTLQFLEPDPTGIMERIGRLHGGDSGGGYRVLRREELARP